MTHTYDNAHGLLLDVDSKPVNFVASPNIGGVLSKPSLLVMHYTGSGGADNKGDVGWFQNKASAVSAHFVVGRDGGITQCVPLTRKAWHAGKSIWRGVPNCNDYSIGIEFDNWGLLTKLVSGEYISAGKSPLAHNAVTELPFEAGDTVRAWEVYPEAQMVAGAALIAALAAVIPSLNDIAGHQDIAPGRKTDPGPAFDMGRMRTAMEGRKTDDNVHLGTVTANLLNVRSDPVIGDNIVGKLKLNDTVNIQYENGDWSYILFGGEKGWISSRYLHLV